MTTDTAPASPPSPSAAQAAAPGSRASAGLRWAVTMFGLDLVEWLVMLQILLHDQPNSGLPRGWGFLELYFVASTVCFVLQLVGILVVQVGWYRTGGVLQIVASLLHLPKGEGLIGLIGGLKAYRYPQRVMQQA